MRSNLPAYELAAPASLNDALALLATGYRPFAGGTDLMVLAEAGKLPHRRWVSVWGLPELRGITETPERVTLGALTTYSQVQKSELLRREYPLLGAGGGGDRRHRHPEPRHAGRQRRQRLAGRRLAAGAARLRRRARADLARRRAPRPLRQLPPRLRKMDLGTGELIRAIHLPRRPAGRWREVYRKVGTRRAQAISKICLAGALALKGGVVEDVRLALGSVAPIPLRCTRTEAVLRRQPLTAETIAAARDELGREIAPIDDFRSTARYRLHVAQELLVDFLRSQGG